MANSDRSIEVGAWMLEHGHRLMLMLTGGRYPKKILGMQPVELHTTGRKTGARRSTMLTGLRSFSGPTARSGYLTRSIS